jgi:hypothetical protein
MTVLADFAYLTLISVKLLLLLSPLTTSPNPSVPADAISDPTAFLILTLDGSANICMIIDLD